VRERPIIFNGEMVRAILDGRKTQTRRPINVQPSSQLSTSDIRVGFYNPTIVDKNGDEVPGAEVFGVADTIEGFWGVKFPYGKPGDRLWVRETVYIEECVCQGAPVELRSPCRYCSGVGSQFFYRADTVEKLGINPAWTPSIHMPRFASRITLEITGVRVERVKDITEDDAKLEGVQRYSEDGGSGWGQYDSVAPSSYTFRWGFKKIWNDIYSERDSWGLNPLVWVIDFKRI